MATSKDGPTLHEALAAIGWRSEKGHENANGRVVYTASGECLGQVTAGDVWDLLRERGLMARASVSR
jgi:hypothetical protein